MPGTMRTVAELTLGREPDAVPRARRMVREALADVAGGLAADAELVISELVTNAALHGHPPIIARVLLDRVVRLEVADTGRSAPIILHQGAQAMTGRGLSMVAALASAWGVDSLGEAKVVWAELDPDGRSRSASSQPEIDIDALLEGWADDDPATAAYTVRLGPVSTTMLLEAKAHIDNVVRELVLMREGQATSGVMLPPEVAALIQTVTVDFAEARTEIKRQAAAAAARGESLTELELHLSPSSVEAGERYLEALDEVDRYARGAHLLTLAAPRVHRVFRRWYVGSLIEQLRALAAGRPASAPTPFQVVLAKEMAEIDELADEASRLLAMQKISQDLARATTVEEMAGIAVDHAVRYLGVETARVRLLTPEGRLVSVAWRGRPGAHDHGITDIPLNSPMPGAFAVRKGQAVHVGSMRQALDGEPELAAHYRQGQSGHAVPLTAGDEMLGVLTLTFSRGELTHRDELAFVGALAEVLGEALRRAEVVEGAGEFLHASVDLLTHQKEVLERIVAGDPLTDVLDALVGIVESATGGSGIASVLVLDPDGRRLRHGSGPGLPAAYNLSIDGLEIGPMAGSCGTAAFTRKEVIAEDIVSDPRWESYRDLALPFGLRACWSTPIIAGDGELLGTFAVYYRQARAPSAEERGLVSMLIQTAALAVVRDRSDRLREAVLANEQAAREDLERAHEQMSFLLDAATRVMTSLGSDDMLRTLARIAVPALADICLIHLIDGVGFHPAVAAVSEAVHTDLDVELARTIPDPGGPHPAAQAVRSGRAVTVGAGDDPFLRTVGAHSCIGLPLAARGRTLGAMTLLLVQAGREYTDSDVTMMEDLARRVSLAVDNTQLYESVRDAHARLSLVSRAGAALTSSLELETVVGRLCELITGDVADYCEVHVHRPPGQWWRFTPGSARNRLVRVDGLPARAAEAVDSGNTMVGRWGPGEAFSGYIPRTDDASSTIIPLLAHGEAVGVIAMSADQAGGPARVPAETVEVIAGRAALALDNALLYEQERTAAEILQRSLLPPHLPKVGGLRSAARYLPAGARNEVGGDWYDMFALAPDRVGVVMGDVMGRGIPAASIMGQLRNGLRALAAQGLDPAAALRLLNGLLGDDDESPIATVAYGVLDMTTRQLALANAGHLPPLLRRGGSAAYLEQTPSLPLGAFPDPTYSTTVYQLEAGDLLVMYTDGLIERRDRGLEEGLEALVSAASHAPGADPDEVCEVLLTELRGDAEEDDTAALVLTLDPQ